MPPRQRRLRTPPVRPPAAIPTAVPAVTPAAAPAAAPVAAPAVTPAVIPATDQSELKARPNKSSLSPSKWLANRALPWPRAPPWPWVKKVGLPRGLGLLGPSPVGLFRGLGLLGPNPVGLFRGLGLGDPRPVGLWFGLGLLVWSGLGSGGRDPPRAPPAMPRVAGAACRFFCQLRRTNCKILRVALPTG